MTNSESVSETLLDRQADTTILDSITSEDVSAADAENSYLIDILKSRADLVGYPVSNEINAFEFLTFSSDEIVKYGLVQRQGRIMKSSWHATFLILTRTGFIHCYSIPKESEFNEFKRKCLLIRTKNIAEKDQLKYADLILISSRIYNYLKQSDFITVPENSISISGLTADPPDTLTLEWTMSNVVGDRKTVLMTWKCIFEEDLVEWNIATKKTLSSIREADNSKDAIDFQDTLETLSFNDEIMHSQSQEHMETPNNISELNSSELYSSSKSDEMLSERVSHAVFANPWDE